MEVLMREITAKEEYDLNHSMSAAQHPSLGTRIKYLQTQDKYHYAGVRKSPDYTTSGSNIIVGEGTYALYSDSSGSSLIEVFDLDGGTFGLQDSITTYIYCHYDETSGCPVVTSTTDRELVVSTNFTNSIPIFTCYNYQNVINVINWKDEGLALAEKHLLREIDTDRFHHVSGLQTTEYGTRNVNVTSGSLYYGVNRITIQDFASGSSSNYMYLISHDALNVWTGSPVTQYNNTSYQGSSGLVTLTNSQRYSVNWIFRVVSDNKRFVCIVLGTGDYKLDEALGSTVPPILPNVAQTQSILVSRIIVQKDANVATNIDSAFDIGFSPTSLDHNSLFGLDGGDFALNEYYHLTQDNYNKISGSSYEAIFGDAVNYTAFEADGTMIMSGSATVWEDLRFPATAINPVGAPSPMGFDTTRIAFTAATGQTQTIAVVAQLPHSWKIGSTIYPHVHWQPTTTNTGSVLWRIEYKWNDLNTVEPANFIPLDVSQVASGSAYMHQLIGWTISGSAISNISSLLTILVSRIGGSDSYTGTALLKEFDIHYEVNTLGSRTPLSK